MTWIDFINEHNWILVSNYTRVTHFAKNWRIFSATSFLGVFYLVMKENAKKVGKSWHLGVHKHPPWFMYCASLLYSIWIWPFEFNIQFGQLPVVFDAQTPSQTIRHEKIHDIRHQECPDWTILKDFMPSEQKTSFPEIRWNPDP